MRSVHGGGGWAPAAAVAAALVAVWPAATAADAQAAAGRVVDGTASPGTTGWAMLPSSRPPEWGALRLGYDTALPGYPFGTPRGHNLLVGVGLWPGLEVTGRLASRWWGCVMYLDQPEACESASLRDLSASVRLGHEWALPTLAGPLGQRQPPRFQVAAGATDLGGAATHFRSTYAVAGLEGDRWRVQAGLAKAGSTSAPLSGFMAGLAWRPMDPVQLQLEAIGARRWVSARLMLPQAWRPGAVTPWLSVQRSLQDDGFTPREWWSVGVNVALDRPDAGWPGGRPRGAAEKPVVLPATPTAATALSASAGDGAGVGAQAAAQPSTQDSAQASAQGGRAAPGARGGGATWVGNGPHGPVPAPVDWARQLATALGEAGFEDIGIGRARDRRVVVAENSGYEWNGLDALGVALGLATRQALPPGQMLDVRVTRRGLTVWRVVGEARCLHRWLRQDSAPAECQGLRFSAGAQAGASQAPDASDGGAEVQWWLQGHRASFGRPRLAFSADLDTRVGTEYGVLDTSAGIDLTLQVPLWRGATADLAYVQALGHSSDYDPGGPFADFRIDSMVYRAMLHQALPLAPGLDARLAVGRLFKRLDGGTLELRWQPGDGRHRFTADASQYRHTEVDFTKRSQMLAYRYFAAGTQTAWELRGGRFWHGDQGAVASAKQWFGDVSVALVLRRSHFPAGSPSLYSPYGDRWVNAAGVEFSFPLTPRRESVGHWLQLRGQDRFSYGVQTVVGQSNTNHLTPWFGRLAPVPLGLSESVDHFDRASQAYLDSNLHRLREAWRQLGPGD